MKRMTAVALVVLLLVGMALAGCAVELIEAPMEGEGIAMTPDFVTNPELRFLDRPFLAGSAVADVALETSAMPAVFFVTAPEHLAGTWACQMDECERMIQLDLDGTVSRVLGPNDIAEIGYFWFSDGAFHVVSEIDEAAAESAFHVFAETEGDVTFLRFKQCGGNCADAAGIEWLQGLTQVEPAG